MKKQVLHFLPPIKLRACLLALLCFPFVSVASVQSPDDTKDMQVRDSLYAATKHALNLNVGEPRTVRMIYFLPNDRPFRQEVVQKMKDAIRQIQTFFAEQMQARVWEQDLPL